MDIKIPRRYSYILNQDIEWRSFVDNLIQNTEAYFTESPYFFPEYTYHGIKHINNVLEISDKLIDNESLNKLQPISIAVLISSIIIHDIGMFIKRDGLYKLIFGIYKERKDEYLDSDCWETLWKKYFKEVARYSAKKLLNVFGSPNPIHNINDLKSDLINEKDKMVYGEFIRQNHHRISHEIILYGFIGTIDKEIIVNNKYHDILNLIGIVARSHGMNIRDTEEYLQAQFGGNDNYMYPLDIPIFFIMILLRLADFLDAGLERAPKELSDSQKMFSYISRNEWRWNQTLSYQQGYRWDEVKKKINIHARPQNSYDFIGVEKWITDVQKEIDNSWAYLAEYYLNTYSLTIHRITSNILDANARKIYERSFLTKAVKLKVEPEIAKLLVKPLYNGNRSYAIRELVQNAVDACNERENLESTDSYIGKVIISVDTKSKKISVIDNGTGMNEDILLNYYLTVGASYRYSENWNILNIDVNGNSKVTRTGKFGIGAMSAFLLGNKITIITQYMNEKNGYKTTFSMESTDIEVEIVQRKEGTGTTIEIEMDETTIEYFLEKNNRYISDEKEIKWYNWFYFKKPVVKYYLDDEEVYQRYNFVPNEKEDFLEWIEVRNKEFLSYKYSYKELEPQFYSNGIIFPYYSRINFDYYGMRLNQLPSISIVDRDDKLSVGLLRDKFIVPIPEILLEDIYKKIIYELVNIEYPINSNHIFIDDFERYLIYDKKGYTLFEPAFISILNADKIIFVLDDFHDRYSLAQYNKFRESFKEFEDYPLCYLPSDAYGLQAKSYYNFYMVQEKIRFFLSNYYNKNLTKKNKAYKRWNEHWKLSSNTFMMNLIYNENIASENNIIIKLLNKYLHGNAWIPYSLDERKKLYPEIFNEFLDK